MHAVIEAASMRRLIVLCALVAMPLAADSAFTNKRTVTKLADGVYEIRHIDPFPGYVNGNTTVIIGSHDVFVVDSCDFASAARADIDQIRTWTDKPVRYLLNTHWHGDHTSGNNVYFDAFPGLAILAHRETKERLEAGSATFAEKQAKTLDDALAKAKKALETGKGSDGKPLTDKRRKLIEQVATDLPMAIADTKAYRYQPPTLTFEDGLTVDIGGETVEVIHPGRGNTAGDAIVYLPKEKILITGDLVVHPVPFTFDGYPREWIGTLEKLAAFDAVTIVPGHGEILHDKTYILQLRDLFKSVVDQIDVQLAKDSEMPLDDVKKGVDVHQFRDTILADDRDDVGFFNYAMDSLIGIAYHEARQR